MLNVAKSNDLQYNYHHKKASLYGVEFAVLIQHHRDYLHDLQDLSNLLTNCTQVMRNNSSQNTECAGLVLISLFDVHIKQSSFKCIGV